MRTDRVARVRAGFGRAALSNPNGATSRTARRAPPRRPGPSVAAPLFVGWDGIGPVRRSSASDGRSSRGKVEAVEDCRSRLIVQDECDEIQATTALTGQCVDVMDALQELGPVNTCRWFTEGGRRDIPGSDGSHAMRGWVTASASKDWQGGRFHDSCDRHRRRSCDSCGTVRGAAAVFVSLMATRQPERNDLLSPRRVRREHTVEPDQGWRGGGISAASRARNCSGDITRCVSLPHGLRIAYAMRPSSNTLSRSRLSGGLAQ